MWMDILYWKYGIFVVGHWNSGFTFPTSYKITVDPKKITLITTIELLKLIAKSIENAVSHELLPTIFIKA